jgi:hypothetical protein
MKYWNDEFKKLFRLTPPERLKAKYESFSGPINSDITKQSLIESASALSPYILVAAGLLVLALCVLFPIGSPLALPVAIAAIGSGISGIGLWNLDRIWGPPKFTVPCSKNEYPDATQVTNLLGVLTQSRINQNPKLAELHTALSEFQRVASEEDSAYKRQLWNIITKTEDFQKMLSEPLTHFPPEAKLSVKPDPILLAAPSELVVQEPDKQIKASILSPEPRSPSR